MAGSLQDQLLNLGVANKKQANEAKSAKRKQAKARKAGKANQESESAEAKALLAKQEKAARDRELNLQREAERAKRAAEAEVAQLIDAHKVSIPATAEVPYNFVHGTKIKKLYVTGELQDQLFKARLAIAVDGDSYRLIPRPIAEKIALRDAERVIFTKQEAAPDEDDPYADYQIPDDLMW